MSRVRLLVAEQAPPLARPYYGHGDPGPIVAALAHVPEVLEATLPFVGAVLGPTSISVRTKELVILRTSALLADRFCVQTHRVLGREAGLGAQEIRALCGEAPLEEAFDDPREQVLLSWVEAVADGPGPVSTPLANALRSYFTDAQVVELTLLIGATVMLNRFCTALDLPTSPEVLAELDDGADAQRMPAPHASM
jgi:AhpD family alkylhydroperoxidase